MRIAAILAASIALTACDRFAEVHDLRAEVQSLKKDLDALTRQVTEDRMYVFKETSRVPDASVQFDARDTSGYGQVFSNLGVLLVKLQSVEPYLDGYTLTFVIGNPTSAKLSGVKGTVKWGPEIDWQNLKENKELQSKSFDLPQDFAGGTWTAMKVNVGPAKPEQVRRIVFAPVFNSVSLRTSTP